MKLLANCSFMILLLSTPEIGTAQGFETAEVVPVDSLKQAMIYRNLKSWLESEPRKGVEKLTRLETDSANGAINGDFEVLVYSQSGILKKVSGAVSFHLTIEMKDLKYRYRYSDFKFHYMKQDRYYQTVKTGKTKSLNESEARGWQSTWNDHRNTIAQTVHKQTTEMKAIAAKLVTVKSAVATVTDW